MEYKKKLIEVSIPLKKINEACIKEKSIRQGHPSTLHIYWARRPLASARAVIFCTLVDDPSQNNNLNQQEILNERKRLFKIVEQLVKWENINNQELLEMAYKEIVNSCGEVPPTILDPFSGGGTIPGEAQKLGLTTIGTDLNPVSVIITKGMIELPYKNKNMQPINPEAKNLTFYNSNWKNNSGLANDLRYYGKKMKSLVFEKIGNYYPLVGGKPVIVWLWTKVVKCANPTCNSEIPLANSFNVFKSGKKKVFTEPVYNSKGALNFKISSSNKNTAKYGRGSNFKCFICSQVTPNGYVKEQSRDGLISEKLMAIVTESSNNKVIDPDNKHIEIALSANPVWKPSEPMQKNNPTLVSGRGYGYNNWSDLFSNRQLLAITNFIDTLPEIREMLENDGATSAYSDAIITYLAFSIDRCTNYWSSFAPWGGSFIVQTFGRQAIPMIWDYAEANPFSNSTGSWDGAVEWVAKVLEKFVPSGEGISRQVDVSKSVFSDENTVVITDPPYYDNIMYADLSDFFYIWMRKMLNNIYPEIFKTIMTPKDTEIVASTVRQNGDKKLANEHFLNGLSKAAENIINSSNSQYPIVYYYAFKQSETNKKGDKSSTGWEVFLDGLIKTKHQITATWPMRTERDQGFKTGSNVLASSIIISTRRQEENSEIATRKEFIDELEVELESAILNMMSSDIAPVDMQQSSIGPGMAVFTKYAKVLEADGSPMTVRTALQIINSELDRIQENSEIEMDSDTRFCIQWFDSYGFDVKSYGEAETLANAKDISVEGLVNSGVFIAGGGEAKLKHWSEMKSDWDPREDDRLTLWECTHYIIRELVDGDGELGAARLAKFMGNQKADEAKELAYQLYHICDKREWTKHASDYNILVSNWSDIKSQIPNVSEGQETLF